MGFLDTIKGGASDLWENCGGKYVAPAVGLLSHPIGMAINGVQALGHTAAGAYDAVTGDREGAVHHGAEALTSGLGMIPGIGHALHGAEAVWNFAAGGKNSVDGSKPPTMGEAIGLGANGVADEVLGKPDHDKKEETSTAQGVLGTLGSLAGMVGGPLGVIAGGGIGRAIGGLFS